MNSYISLNEKLFLVVVDACTGRVAWVDKTSASACLDVYLICNGALA